MPDSADDNTDYSPYDSIEAIAEITADDPELTDWHNTYQGTLEMVGIDGASASVVERIALRHIAGCPRDVVYGVWDLITTARQMAYEEGFHHGLEDARSDPDDEEEEYDGPSS